MQTLFGLPIFGSLFTPILITIVSVLLYKTFFSLSKGDMNVDDINVGTVKVKDNLKSEEMKSKAKQKKKKSCSGKKGGKGCCSTKNGIIDTTKVFVESSSHSKELGKSLIDLWNKESLSVEVVSLNSNDLESQLKEETASVSLCVFLLDKNEESPVLRPWLEASLEASPLSEKLLAGLKYSVFITNGNVNDNIHLETDRALHRLGGVRVSKAGIVDSTAWLEGLSETVKKWNQSGKIGCKCGPDSANENEEERSACSGSCSSSEDEIVQSVLDLEDLGKALS